MKYNTLKQARYKLPFLDLDFQMKEIWTEVQHILWIVQTFMGTHRQVWTSEGTQIITTILCSMLGLCSALVQFNLSFGDLADGCHNAFICQYTSHYGL